MREQYRSFTRVGKITIVIMAVILLMTSTGTAWAVHQCTWEDKLISGDYWHYSFATAGEVGVLNGTAYNAPVKHCTQLKSNGVWMQVVGRPKNETASYSNPNTKKNPVMGTDYDASIGISNTMSECVAALAVYTVK